MSSLTTTKPLWKKLLLKRAKKVPPYTATHWMCVFSAMIIMLGWFLLKDVGLFLNYLPVINDVLGSIEGWPLFAWGIGRLLYAVTLWRVAIPLLCRTIQVWFPDALDGYKVESDTLADV